MPLHTLCTSLLVWLVSLFVNLCLFALLIFAHLGSSRDPLKWTLPRRVVCVVTAWNHIDDCFCQMPISRTKLCEIVVWRGCSPPRPSGPTGYGSRTLQLPLRHRLVQPHAAKALAPTQEASFAVMVALRLYPERKTPLPSRRVKWHCATVAPSVPSRKMAPFRCSAQSPPLGIPCGSRSVRRVSCRVRPRTVRPMAGRAFVPTWERRARVVVTSHT
mmetsp:Transcript_47331/g.157746  ORF Transcript_47331/g.157746 Transcript_47331/m.157746 type:complete len:216 (-) Transcript_47331:151-798(-)